MSYIKRLGVGLLVLLGIWVIGFLPLWVASLLVSMLTWGTGREASFGLTWTALGVVVTGLAYLLGGITEVSTNGDDDDTDESCAVPEGE